MSDLENSGIVGDVQNVANLAVGTNSRIEVTNVGQSAGEQLQALRHAVEAFGGPADTRSELLAAHRELETELEAPTLDQGRVLSKLRQIATVAGSTTTIATAVSALATALQLVL
jgi:hypothetical protein